MIKNYIICLSIFSISCTSNPFWNDPGTSELILYGQISIENNNLDTPALVWMEGADSFEKTDQNGSFSIVVKNTQRNELSVSGSVKVYFFIYNYQLDSAVVNFTNGRLSNNQSDFSVDGELIKPIQLKQIISGNLQLELLDNSFYNQESVHLIFNIQFHNSVNIELYKYIWDEDTLDFHSGLIFQNTTNDSIILYRYTGYDDYGNIINDQLRQLSFDMNKQSQWRYIINTNQLNLLSGEYKIFPYFKIYHHFLPLGMIDVLGGEEIFTFSKEYITLPNNIIYGSVIID